jgi:hypothetical protein
MGQGLMQGLPGAGHGQVAVTNASESGQLIGQFLNFFGLASHHDDFKAVVVIHMDMSGGDDMMMVVMLHKGNFLLQFVLVMIIHQADDAHNLFIGLPFFFDKRLPNQIPYRFRAIAVTVGFYVLIENAQQLFLKRYGKSLQHENHLPWWFRF